jgi:hypothetical protein
LGPTGDYRGDDVAVADADPEAPAAVAALAWLAEHRSTLLYVAIAVAIMLLPGFDWWFAK